MKIAVDIQHKGRPARPNDRGCFCNGRHETDYTERYGKRIYELLAALGHEVVVLTEGEYRDRQALANKLGAELYLACHVNAGGGKYSLVIIPNEAPLEAAGLAEGVAANLREALGTSNAVVKRLLPGERGSKCIDDVEGLALLIEPFFIDDLPVADMVATDGGIELLAQAVVDAIDDLLPHARPRLSRTAG